MTTTVGITAADVRNRVEEMFKNGAMDAAIEHANQRAAEKMAEAGQADPLAATGTAPAAERVESATFMVDGHGAAVKAEPADAGAERAAFLAEPTDTYTYGDGETHIPLAPRQATPILDEARRIVSVRGQDYGENSLPAVAAYWSQYLGQTLTGRDVGKMMVLLKIARDQHEPKDDNLVDGASYLDLAGAAVCQA
ncbi:DUF6378 domain-containing protein [Rhodococcus maanshanensis]|uniref:DUF6378 domain-containing protein n=1 Tax=Rhodococcus maanshanensis TaxID=183556 RepID=UPI0022B3A655|nr:DUF6378 domain-containing protein [Rhodococcus maanshanensis]MCZ4557971.1 DUF6378 domain-containing protein [Rhodococcus maanshanensis]